MPEERVPGAGDNEKAGDRARRVLIVDDEQAVTKIINATAGFLGCETCEVNDGRAATDAFIDFHPDVLVLDLIMPGKDGIDILNEVSVVDPSVRVLLISGYGEASLRLAESICKFHSCEHVVSLRKPFRIDALSDALRQMAAP